MSEQKRMKKTITLQTVFILFFSFFILFTSNTPSFSAQKKSEGTCYNREWMQRAAFIRSYIDFFRASEKEIDLSAEQVKNLEEILESCTRTCLKLGNEVEKAEKSIEELLSAIDEKSDKKIIINKVKSLYALKAKLDLSHFQLLGKAEQLLSDEQKLRLGKISRPSFQQARKKPTAR